MGGGLGTRGTLCVHAADRPRPPLSLPPTPHPPALEDWVEFALGMPAGLDLQNDGGGQAPWWQTAGLDVGAALAAGAAAAAAGVWWAVLRAAAALARGRPRPKRD